MKSCVDTFVGFLVGRNHKFQALLVGFWITPCSPARSALSNGHPVPNNLLEVVFRVQLLAVGAAFEWCDFHQNSPVEIKAASAVSKVGNPLKSHEDAPNGSWCGCIARHSLVVL